jgi:farnesyl diphosphate synthase
MSLAAALEENSRLVEEELDRLLPPVIMSQGRLHDAMRYAVLGGGKRLRAFLVNQTGSVLGAGSAACLRVAVALEMMHAYSLIHDDLPAMDDAALRRGRTSCHLAFDEATAILAGDALQALAYDVIATASSPVPAAARAPIVAELARASGALGMCGGQMLDLQGEVDPQDLDGVMLTQRMKTGALFEFACSAACHLSEHGMAARPDLREFARCFGLAFQIRDDILDETGPRPTSRRWFRIWGSTGRTPGWPRCGPKRVLRWTGCPAMFRFCER